MLLAVSAALPLFGDASANSGLVVPRIPFDSASVTWDGRAYVVTWRADRIGHVRILAGTDPRHFEGKRVVGRGPNSGQIVVSNLSTNAHWYFELLPNLGEPLVIADRAPCHRGTGSAICRRPSVDTRR